MKPDRITKRKDCAITRYRLLAEALEGTKNVPSALLESCSTQASLAALSIPSHDIEKVSLNTLKASANASIELGGWLRLDEMRRQYRKLSRNKTREKNDRPATISADEALALERRLRIRLEIAYLDLLTQLAKIAEGDSYLDDFLKRHQAGFAIERMKAVSGVNHGS